METEMRQNDFKQNQLTKTKTKMSVKMEKKRQRKSSKR